MTAVAQPSGTVTLVFTDIEGSTRLLDALGMDAYRDALAEHRRVVREAFARFLGYEVDYEGDAFFYAFPSAQDAVSAVSEAMAGLEHGPISIRVGIHTGEPALDPPKYVGMDVHFAARVMSSAHGGQVVCSQATAELVDLPLTSLGSHRLKDIAEPVSLYQLGAGSFPGLKTIANSNLPTPASSFLGREDELREADALLRETRLLTISGPGGQGKTRFALELATRAREERFSDYADGVFACFLSSLRDPALVLPTIAQTLSVREQPSQSALDALSGHLQAKKLLLLLDNLEHLLEAAPELSQLLLACPQLTLLVTSRELLRIQGEEPYALPPLPQDEGIALFCERSKLEPSSEIAEICTRLEGLPLAIELAAARTRILTPEQLLERLSQRLDLLKGGRDADPRQQTLRATIEWSYDLLSPEEQQLFTRLSVFAGGCTLEAAERVAEADLDTLQSLVDKSLLRFTNERFWMLETIREYAKDRSGESAAAERTKQRHVEFFQQLADEAEPELRGPHAGEWLDRLEVEHHNLRAALSRVADEGQDESYVRLAGALARFWWTRAYLEEGTRWLDDALARPGTPPDARARAYRGLGYLAWPRGERSKALRCHEDALALYREIGDSFGTSMSLMNLGVFWREEGDLPRARQLMEQAATIQRASGDLAAVAHVLAQLGLVALAEGDLERAAELCEDGLALAREAENDYTVAIILRATAPVALQRGDHVAAAEHFGEGLVISMRLGYQGALASGLKGVAAAVAASGDYERAARILGTANALDVRLHGNPDPPEPPDDALFLAIARSHMGDERAYEAWAEGRSISTEHAVEYALASIDSLE